MAEQVYRYRYLFLGVCLCLLGLHGGDLVPTLGGVPLGRLNGDTKTDNVATDLSQRGGGGGRSGQIGIGSRTDAQCRSLPVTVRYQARSKVK